ncbi:MAG: CehA/McbA family metallohydrolase, partial [Gammaproteobacteria bacterium]|nr:CehA/McbA family metallohydrolase [Gammaproteobacteria bacterium]
VGTTRTYVHTGEGRLDYDAWADAMAAGRAFVTSGPILKLDVSGRDMGEELQVAAGERVTVNATAESLFRMHRLEIIQDGRVVHAVEAGGDGKSLSAELEIPVENSGWIAVRALGPPQHGAMDSYLFAHTNPVFVIADDEPIRSREDAAFFVRWIDQVLYELRFMDRWDDPAHKEEVLATFEEGRRLYQAQVEDP